LQSPTNENVLVGLTTSDDAGVYRVSEELALIQTLDFFTPIVDDPFDFGRIAAANSLSDIYAMGGVPKSAMNIVAYPMASIGPEPLREMLAGGAATLREADTVLLGGHSIEDDEMKYGLSVTGFVHPERIIANQGLRDGDCLVLTKPIGTGILNTAIKAGLVPPETIYRVTELMASLNRKGAEIMSSFTISACTDITGFGLLGHMAEMISGTGTGVIIEVDKVPLLEKAYEFGSMGFVPIGSHKNREFRKELILAPAGFDPVMRDILFDPQTSGGLLIGCREKEAMLMVNKMQNEGMVEAAIVGVVTNNLENTIQLR